MEVKRLEDAFDLSGPDKPQRHYPTLKPVSQLLSGLLGVAGDSVPHSFLFFPLSHKPSRHILYQGFQLCGPDETDSI